MLLRPNGLQYETEKGEIDSGDYDGHGFAKSNIYVPFGNSAFKNYVLDIPFGTYHSILIPGPRLTLHTIRSARAYYYDVWKLLATFFGGETVHISISMVVTRCAPEDDAA